MKTLVLGVSLIASLISPALFADQISYAVWAGGDEQEAIDWSGSDSIVDGRTHSNGGIKVGGSDNTFLGGVTRIGQLDNSGSGNEYAPPPENTEAQIWPLSHDITDYQPGGSAALQVGEQYVDLSSVCNDDDKWDVSAQGTELAAGLYWVPCDVVLSASNLIGEITIVSTGVIEVSGSDQTSLSAFVDGLLFWTDTQGDLGIKLSGSNMVIDGYLSAEQSQIELSGSDLDFNCGLYGEQIKVSGSSINVTGDFCGIPPNTLPVANSASIETLEDTLTPIVLTASDVDDDALTYSLLSQPANGTLTGVAPNLEYVPNLNFVGTDSFTFAVNDGQGDSAVAAVDIIVIAVNDVPVALDQSATLNEDDSVTVVLTAQDADQDTLSYQVVSQPQYGTITQTGAEIIYTPGSNYAGQDQFTFVVNDGEADSTPATVTLEILPINDAPIAIPQTVSVAEDNSVALQLLGTDVDGDSLVFSLTRQPDFGVLSGTAPELTYSPNTDFNGTDSISYTVSDGIATSSEATVLIEVQSANDAPIAEGQTVSLTEDVSKSLVLTGSDIDGDALSYTITRPPTFGDLTGTAPTLTYTPNENYAGDDSFEFTVSDGLLTSAEVTVILSVAGTNDVPIAYTQAVTTDEDTELAIALTADDPDGDQLTYSIVTPPAFGTLNGSAPNVVYTPSADYFGADQFSFLVNDGEVDSATVVVDIQVASVNDAPVANIIDIATLENTSVDVVLSATDVDSELLIFTVVTQPQNGMLSGEGSNLLYSPNTNYSGTDSFMFSVNDGTLSASSTVNVNIEQVNSAPIITSSAPTSAVVNEEYVYSVVATDDDNDVLTFSLQNAPLGMNIDAGTGAITWTPDSTQQGAQSYTVIVNDTNGGETEETVSVSVIVLTQPISYLGREFWFMFNDNVFRSSATLSVTVTSIEGAAGTLTVPSIDLEVPFLVPANGVFVHQFDVALNEDLMPLRQKESKAIHIVTDNDVAVYALNRAPNTTDGTLVFPVKSLGQHYTVATYHNAQISALNRSGSEYAIVSTQDNTLIDLTPTYDHFDSDVIDTVNNNPYVSAGDTITIELNQGDTFYVQLTGSFYGNEGTPTGSVLSANKPIAVFGAHECAHVPEGIAACDHLVEQIPSDDVWGTTYVTAPFATRRNGDLFRVVASIDNTHLTINNELAGVLNAGEYLDTVVDTAAVFTSDKPVLVAQLSTGAYFDRFDRETPESEADPFMIFVPPTEQFLTDYVVATPAMDIRNNYLTIVARDTGIDRIMMNEVELDAAVFTRIADSLYYYANLPIDVGSHVLTSDIPFGLYIYGFDEFESYGYVGGQAFGSDELTSVISLSGPATSEVGTEACVVATLTSESNTPVAAQQVAFTIQGVSDKRLYALSDRFGEASVCYTSVSVGSDSVSVSVNGASDVLGVNWTKDPAINHPSLFLSVPPATVDVYQPFAYTVQAVDPDLDATSVTLVEGPDGASLSAGNLVQWAPSAIGDYHFVLSATDGQSTTLQRFRIAVASDIHLPPVYVSESPTRLSHKNVHGYYYDPVVVQYRKGSTAENVAFREFVDVGPVGYRYNTTRRAYFWNPNESQVGENSVVIGVSDKIGQVSRQSFTVDVTDTNPPVFVTTLPTTELYFGDLIEFDVLAEDADGDPITYGFKNFSFASSIKPDGMTIDANTGRLSYTPAPADKGTYRFTISAEDDQGGQIHSNATVTVLTRAEVTSTPILLATAGVEYRYDVDANNPASPILVFSLTEAPTGMSINTSTGEIIWTPGTEHVGEIPVTVQIDNRYINGFAEHSFTITVSGPVITNTPPQFLSTPTTSVVVGENFLYAPDVVDDDGDELSFTLVNGPSGMVIDGQSGVVSWLPDESAIGDNVVTIAVDDGTVSVSQGFTLSVQADSTGPVVDIQHPDHLATITEPVDIYGTITDPNLRDWRLIAQRRGTEGLIELASGTVEKAAEFLGRFDPSMQLNGLYTLAIQAFDDAGNETLEGVTITVDGDLKVGNFSITFNDLAIPMVGIPIEVNRTYDSRRRAEDLDFGYGWSIDYQNIEVTESRTLGRGWEMNQYGDIIFGDIPEFCIESLGTPTVTVRLPDDQLEEFKVVAENTCNNIPIYDTTLGFEAKSGTTSELRALNNRSGRLSEATGEIAVLAGAVLDPSRYELTTKAGYVYILDQDFGIETVTDPNGHVLTYNDTGIVHSAGKRIDFVRDATGRITEITDPSGNLISYSYDANDDLIAVTDRAFATTDFTYNTNHGLLDIIDPLGNRIVRNIYNDDGRMIAQEDNLGNRTEFNHNLLGRESIVTDRLGRATTYYYDDRGNVTSKVDALGQLYTYTYDEFDNQLSETNPLGHTTNATFDDRYNQLTQSDALGNTISYAYNARGQEIQIVDARGNTYNNTYDSAGNLLTVSDPLGNIAGQSINTQGLPFLRRDAEGNDTTFEYDDEGNITKETDAEGGVTTYTYDENNNRLSESRNRTVNGVTQIETTTYEYNSRDQVTKTTDALGNITQTEYDQLGRESAQIDAKSRRTTMAYDSYGRLTSTTYPDGTTDTSTYDVEGNKLSDTDRLGRTTQYSYDALNRQLSTTYPDGASMNTAYDAAGRTISETDPRGNTTTYNYDAANRRTSTTDALDNTRSYGFDADGNMISETDARGHTTTYTYNALDQRTRTTYADNTTTSSAFDKRGLEISKTDQNGKITQYGYDGLGRLVSVTDALDQVTQYGYDEVGNKLTQTDALGRVTSWAYDAINRPVSRILPMGQQETYAYDPVGNRTSHTDFNGATHTFVYDVNYDWLTTENWADGKTISYAYNAVGLRTSAADSNGTFTYSYDNRDRLTREVKHNGSELLYGYDAAGNRTTLSTVVAGSTNTTHYTFDALNRLATVTDANANETTYSYDANSNQTKIDQANGTVTMMVFDALNRVTEISHLGTDNSALSTLSYTLDDAGRRTAITESSGRVSNYTYDDLYRLTGDDITDPDNGNHSASYSYDAVSNRMESTINGATISYTYDNNDRLLTAGNDSYSYDENGNTLSEFVDGQAVSSVYDSRNRLVEANRGSIVQTMAYDPDGARIEKSTGINTTEYLIDANRDYAQILYESNGNTELNYTFGNDLVGLAAGLESYTYHTDALGSTRLLSDSAGLISDDIRYDAWGEKLAGGAVAENQYMYTGEQYDYGLDKVFLRARYYTPGVGRFSQMDKWAGDTSNPISLNKYVYANGAPTNNTDPTGMFSIGSLMSGINGASNLISVVQTTIDFIGLSGSEPIDENDSSETLWDILMAYVISGVNSNITTDAAAGIAGVSLAVTSVEKHHTIPIYVCGHNAQQKSLISRAKHREIHRRLYRYSLAVNVAGKSIDLIFKRPKSRKNRTPIQRLARTKAGRTAISAGLAKFYSSYDYLNIGTPTIGAAFGIEQPRFIAGHSSYSSKCQR